MPRSPTLITPSVRLVIIGRGMRGFVDGFVSVILVVYLRDIGYSAVAIGAIVTGTLVGSAVLTLFVGLIAHRLGTRRVLLASCVLMCATGIGFFATTSFWPFLLVAIVGTLNPSAGDVSVFLPTELGFVANEVDQAARPHVYARYNLAGALAGAFGALAAAVPMVIAHWLNVNVRSVERSGFLFYSGVAIVIAIIYRGLPRGYVAAVKARRRMRPRRIVLELSALFSLDAAAGGLVVQSLLVLWLHLRFDLSIGATAAVFFATGVLGALSQLLSGPLAKRIGLIRTMAFTHMPASALLALAAFMPNAGLAITLLLIRSLFSSMDVPARQSFVMAVVPPEERAAAAGITNVPRSLASAATPLAAGALLAKSTFGWPLLLAGLGKFTYDALLLLLYRETAEAVVD